MNALGVAMRKALQVSYPPLASTRLVDYKVRVPLESSLTEQEWYTLGSTANIIKVRWLAPAQGME